MSFTADDLLARLEEFEVAAGTPRRYVIAFSGGLDSTVMTRVLAEQRARHGKALLAVHVDHRLAAESGNWSRHCQRVAQSLGIEIRCIAVDVDRATGLGTEAAARRARYAAFAGEVAAGDWLLSAHHRDDLAETVLMNLLRGSGPLGLAGIPALRRFADAWVARPLLDIPRAALEAYAAANGLAWIDDPANDVPDFDRNYLRCKVLPLLEKRWPNAAARLATSARLARESAGLLNELADGDLPVGRADRLPVAGLARLSAQRQRNALRRAIGRCGLPPAPATCLASILSDVLPARGDGSPVVRWEGAEARRYRGRLYLLPAMREPSFAGARLGAEPVELGAGLGSLALVPGGAPGLSADCLSAGLTLRARAGGEEIKPVGHRHTRRLKKLLQEEGVVPWMRDRVPLVFSGEQLVAVGDLWLAAAAAAPGGPVPRWTGRPPLY